MTDTSKNILFTLLFAIIYSLNLFFNYSNHEDGNQYCLYGLSNNVNFQQNEITTICQLYESIDTSNTSKERIIADESGKGIEVFGIKFGNLGYSYFFNDISTKIYLYFDGDSPTKKYLVSTIFIFNNFFLLIIISFVLIKLSNYKISSFFFVYGFLTYFNWYVAGRYYGLSLIDDIKYFVQNGNSLVDSIIIIIKSFLGPSFSISGFGIHPRNNSILLICLAFIALLHQKYKISLNIIFLSILFHFWVGVTALIVILFFQLIFKKKTPSLVEFILALLLIFISIDVISSTFRFIFGIFLLIFVLLKLYYDLGVPKTRENYIELNFLLFFNFFLFTIILYSIASEILFHNKDEVVTYMISGLRAEGFQRFNVVNLFIILFLIYNFFLDWTARKRKNRYKT